MQSLAGEVATELEFVPGSNLTLKSWTEHADEARSTKAEIGIDHDLFGIRVEFARREEISEDIGEKGGFCPPAPPSEADRPVAAIDPDGAAALC